MTKRSEKEESKKEVRKEFRLFISKQFSDRTIVGMRFGTEFHETDVDPVELFERAFESTLDDIKRKLIEDKDPIITSIWKSLSNDIRKEKKIEEAEKSLEESD